MEAVFGCRLDLDRTHPALLAELARLDLDLVAEDLDQRLDRLGAELLRGAERN